MNAVAASVDELLAGATDRQPFASADGKSAAVMERVMIDGRPHIVKRLHHGDDWIMRATGDLVCRPVLAWRSGLLDRLPESIDSTIVGAAWERRPDGSVGGAILMRDVGRHLVPEGDDPLPSDQHRRFLDHMAEMHAAFWGWVDDVGLTPLGTRIVWFSPLLTEVELELGGDNPVPTRHVRNGWSRLRARGGPVTEAVLALHADPGPLHAALSELPSTFVHGDWKAGNLGSHPDGRTILIDWAYGGQAPPGIDLAHYLSLNRARLPEANEAAIDHYRDRLEAHGVETEPWWDRHLALSLLTMHCNFGWEKALGDTDEDAEELAWWEDRAATGLEAMR